MGRFARCALAALAAVMLSAATVGVSATTAAAIDTPTVTVTPHDELIDGQQVAVEVSGFPTDPSGAIWGIAECPTSFFQDPEALAEPSSIIIHCSLPVGPNGGSPNGSYDVIASATVRPFLAGNPTVDCISVEGGCAIGVILETPGTGAPSVVAYQAITFAGARSLAIDEAATTTGVRVGDPVAVAGTRFPPGPVEIAQCQGPLVEPEDFSACRTLASANVDDTGAFSTSVSVADPFVEVGTGYIHGCPERCVIAARASDGVVSSSPALRFRPGTISTTPASPITFDQTVKLTLTDWTDRAGTVLSVRQCPRTATRAAECGVRVEIPIDDSGGGEALVHIGRRVGQFDCLGDGCELAAFTTSSDDDAPFGPLPITVVPPATPTLRLTPSSSSNLWDGALIDGSAAGLVPGQRYRVARCDLSGTPSVRSCEALAAAPSIVAGSDTTASLRTSAVQRLTTPSFFPYRYCRRQCGIGLVDEAGRLVVTAPYTIDPGLVIASPSAGLGDGDPVALTAVNIQPSYSGPTVLFPTGQWATAQCDASIGANPSLYEVFERCAIPAGGGVVDATIGSQVHVTVRPPATMTAILGGTIDCTTSPGACVVGLVRWEQDASVSTALTPITFG